MNPSIRQPRAVLRDIIDRSIGDIDDFEFRIAFTATFYGVVGANNARNERRDDRRAAVIAETITAGNAPAESGSRPVGGVSSESDAAPFSSRAGSDAARFSR
jgi:hypothetical protein